MPTSVREAIALIEASNLDVFVKVVSGAYGLYQSHKQVQILNGIHNLLEKITNEIRALKEFIHLEFDENTLRESLAESVSAIQDVAGIESVFRRNHRDAATKFGLARSKASTALYRLIMPPRQLNSLAFASGILVCASNLVYLAKLEQALFRDNRTLVKTTLNTNITILRNFIDKVPQAIEQRFTGRQLSIRYYQPYPGAPRKKHIIAKYTFDGESIEVLNIKVPIGTSHAYYNQQLEQAIRDHKDRLHRDAAPQVAIMQRSVETWERLLPPHPRNIISTGYFLLFDGDRTIRHSLRKRQLANTTTDVDGTQSYSGKKLHMSL